MRHEPSAVVGTNCSSHDCPLARYINECSLITHTVRIGKKHFSYGPESVRVSVPHTTWMERFVRTVDHNLDCRDVTAQHALDVLRHC